jgi:hypothetical protein
MYATIVEKKVKASAGRFWTVEKLDSGPKSFGCRFQWRWATYYQQGDYTSAIRTQTFQDAFESRGDEGHFAIELCKNGKRVAGGYSRSIRGAKAVETRLFNVFYSQKRDVCPMGNVPSGTLS